MVRQQFVKFVKRMAAEERLKLRQSDHATCHPHYNVTVTSVYPLHSSVPRVRARASPIFVPSLLSLFGTGIGLYAVALACSDTPGVLTRFVARYVCVQILLKCDSN